jgi:hypothetical protein
MHLPRNFADKCPQLFSKFFIFLYIYPFKAISNRILHIAKMKEEGKSYYEAPATTVVEVKIVGVVCQSLPDGALLDPNDYTPAPDPFAF